MSCNQELVGLGDSKFDAELLKSEIDHDFFDNPCANNEDFHKKIQFHQEANNGGLDGTTKNVTLPEDRSCINFVGSIEKVPKDDFDETILSGQVDLASKQRKSRNANQGKGEFCLSLDMSENRIQNNQMSEPNLIFSSQSRNRNPFTTAKLLDCLTHTEEQIVDSGPQSSFFDQYLPKDQVSEGSSGESGIVAHDIPEGKPIVSSNKGILFDHIISNYEDSDSNSDISDGESLDTEDEEFVELLEKYYDYIDMGDTDCSDITEVSPMSSLAESPLPFADIQNSEDVLDDLKSPCVDKDAEVLGEAILSKQFKNHPVRMNQLNAAMSSLLNNKPLPPLIIHTMEEIRISSEPTCFPHFESESSEKMMNNNGEGRELSQGVKSSLLMKVGDYNVDENQDFINITGVNAIEGASTTTDNEYDESKANTSSSSRISFRSNTDSTSIGTRSSATSFLSNERKQGRNFSVQQIKGPVRESRNNSSGSSERQNPSAKGYIHHQRFGHGHHHQPLKSSATISRQRQQRRIEHENSMLVKRLQNVKPSKEIVDAFRT